MDTDNLTPEEKIELIRRTGLTNLFYFGRKIIGNEYLTESVHGRLATWLTSPDRKRFKLILLPRDCLKTTFISQTYSLWNLCKDSNTRILLSSEARDLSKLSLKAIKDTIKSNEMFRIFNGELAGDIINRKWNEEEIDVATRTSFSAKETNLSTAGIDVAITGMHFRIIICDDLHSEKNSKTKDQIEKVKEHIKLLMPMLEKDGDFIVIGTRWDDKDTYGWLMELRDDEGIYGQKSDKIFDVYQKSCENDDGSLFYPERLDARTLQIKKAIMGKWLFACQFMNNPIPMEGAIFQNRDIQVITSDKVPVGLFKVILIDPAGMDRVEDVTRDNPDYTAVVCIGIDSKKDVLGLHNLYLLDIQAGIFSEDRAIDVVVSMYNRHRPNILAVEKAGLSSFGKTLLQRISLLHSYIKVHDLKPKGRSKISRIMGLQPYSSNRKIYVIGENDNEEFFEEHMRFPKSRRDDVVDACAYVLDIIAEYGFSIDAGFDALMTDNSKDVERNIYDPFAYILDKR
ncbi:MAG: hypothetical protein WA066_02755 [Candidatus Omnitrophota bacterium]